MIAREEKEDGEDRRRGMRDRLAARGTPNQDRLRLCDPRSNANGSLATSVK